MNFVCQNKNCNNKWSNIVLLELKSTTFSLFLCENHAINFEHELLPKWLKTCEKLRKNQKEKLIMKTWIKTNLSKITLALALTGATTGTIGLIMGGLLTHENKKLDYYLTPDGQAIHGSSIIWWNKAISPDKTYLYFAWKPTNKEDIKWDGTYTPNYFNN